MDSYSLALIELITQATNLVRDGVEFQHSGAYSFKIVLKNVEEIQALVSQASAPKKALLDLRGFERLTRFLPKIIELIERHGSKDDDIPF